MAELRKVKIHRISDCHREVCFDLVTSEAEVVIRLNGEVYRALYCLPTHLEELARGHLISEGICHSSNIKGIEVRPDGSKFAIAVTVGSRNSVKMKEVNSQAKITEASPPGVVFMTFHFVESPANILTNPKLDPISKIPELKVSAVRVEKL